MREEGVMGAGQVHLGQVDLGQGQQGVQDGEDVVHAAQVQVEPCAPDFKGGGQRRGPAVKQVEASLVLAQVHQGVDVRLGDLRVLSAQLRQRLRRVPVRAESGLGQPEVLQEGRVVSSRFHGQESPGVFGDQGGGLHEPGGLQRRGREGARVGMRGLPGVPGPEVRVSAAGDQEPKQPGFLTWKQRLPADLAQGWVRQGQGHGTGRQRRVNRALALKTGDQAAQGVLVQGRHGLQVGERHGRLSEGQQVQHVIPGVSGPQRRPAGTQQRLEAAGQGVQRRRRERPHPGFRPQGAPGPQVTGQLRGPQGMPAGAAEQPVRILRVRRTQGRPDERLHARPVQRSEGTHVHGRPGRQGRREVNVPEPVGLRVLPGHDHQHRRPVKADGPPAGLQHAEVVRRGAFRLIHDQHPPALGLRGPAERAGQRVQHLRF
ncbi:hypothetical protein ACFQDE_20590 [Deinococcus caeni]|uniref:hypothetical protein n=1 Tax=Deinococcus caeni TaxID=569127 RepID=UPI003619AAEB